MHQFGLTNQICGCRNLESEDEVFELINRIVIFNPESISFSIAFDTKTSLLPGNL